MPIQEFSEFETAYLTLCATIFIRLVSEAMGKAKSDKAALEAAVSSRF